MLKQEYAQIERVLKQHGIDDFEIYYEKKVGRTFLSKDQKLEAAEEIVERGIGLRIFHDHRVAFVSTTDLSDTGLTSLCESACQVLALVAPDEDYALPELPEKLPQLDLKDFDPSLAQIPVAKKIALALEMERAARAVDPRIRHVRGANYDEETKESAILNSRGLSAFHQKTDCSLSLMAVAEANGEAESAFEFDFGPFIQPLNPESIGQSAAQQALQYLGGQNPKTAKVPVGLAPLVSGEFLGILGKSFLGDEVLKKRSWLTEKLGQKIYSSKFNLWDDRLLPSGFHTCPFDGEGQAGRRLPLVQAGQLQNYLLDSYYGRKLGQSGNASSLRSGFRRGPRVGFSNLSIAPGELSDKDIFQQIKNGVWVTEVIGMHAADPISGDFSVGAQGFEIEGGELGRPLKKMALAGNLHELLASLEWVGRHHRYYENLGAPTLGFPEISVSGEG